MRWWVRDLPIDRGMYRVDLRSRTYVFVARNPDWKSLTPEENARNKRQLHGLRRVFRDGSTRVLVDRTWPYAADAACPTCGSWIPRDSPCDHDKYECPTCGRRQCLRHWRYPRKTQREAVHFLKSAQEVTGRPCFVRSIDAPRGGRLATRWKIFTSEEDYESYVQTGTHRR